MNKVLFVVFMLGTGSNIYGQSPALNLFYSRGQVMVADGNGMETPDAQQNQNARQIPPGNNIRITEDSQAILFNSDGTMISLTEPGSYSYDSLIMIKKSQEEDLAEYLRFLWQEQIAMSDQDDPSGTDLYISNPSISRSPGMPYLMIRPFGWEQLDGDTIRFLWDNIPEGHYTLQFFEKPKGGKPVAEFSLTDTMFQLPAHTPWFNREVTYYWSVFPQGKPNATRFPFRMMTQETYQQLDQELSALIAGSNPGSGLTWITRASFYDSHKMYGRAQQCYLAAIHAEPENSLFGDLYELFLLRMATPSDVTIYY